MISRKKLRLILSVVSTGLLSIVCASSQAGRSVRSDASDDAFEFLGGFWGTNNQQFGDPGFAAGRTEFKLRINPSDDARFFMVCMSEEGFLKLISAAAPRALTPTMPCPRAGTTLRCLRPTWTALPPDLAL